MYNIIIILLTISIGFTSPIHELTGNIERFSSMMAGSLKENKTIIHNHPSSSVYSSSFIKYPADINFVELFYQKHFNNNFLSASIGLLDYGILSNSNNTSFVASDKKIELSFFNKNWINSGTSISYVWSNIEYYKSASIMGSLFIGKSYFDNHLDISLSLENITYTFFNYSNINETYRVGKKVSINLKPKYLSINLLADYIYYNQYETEISCAIKGNIIDNLNIYFGKAIYSGIYENGILSNISSGIGLILKNYRFNIGFQYSSDTLFSLGSSITIFS